MQDIQWHAHARRLLGGEFKRRLRVFREIDHDQQAALCGVFLAHYSTYSTPSENPL